MEKMESQSSNSARKPIRRRSHARKFAQGSVISMTEARREIARALRLRSSSSSSSYSSTCTKPPSYVTQEREGWMFGNLYNYSTNSKRPIHATSYGCYSLVQAMPMPLPEPVWSTTAPSVPAAAPPATESLEWGGKKASSYTRWLGFVKENSGVVLEQQEISSELFVGGSDENASLDEWLMFPTTEYHN